ncbi:putative mitochondrial ubiqitin hydrolase [Leptomonas pyrrhocoris]|uniref:Putative mitochondrial ubiqitin hydrolase n=1 Tax=Leptomonas pyrrhocoris TaxID=157538 RepID=A0A0M9FWP1_LEPPY|nr:putative mitochondrial ubiqitin hydrolase [Leptomonas pyrrhocoris]KPA77499.1 putative mitochondrial ubiqitin hydrolase [Leptomonas pyrrhocoris]|eukprot:XP_015655938.1 putative mitochondrial ubiqitin hydrolase [Leptomonas pyrrhocoris]
MSVSAKEPPAHAAGQREGTRSFTVEMEECAALPLDADEVSAVPPTPPRGVDKKAGGASGSSVGSSFPSHGASNTNDHHPLSQQQTPQQQQRRIGGRPGNATTSALSHRTTTGMGSAGGVNSLHLVTCLTGTPASQRAAEAAASRDPDFHPMIVCPLQNLGNTCYFNSGVQMLANCPALIYGVRNSPLCHAARSNSPLQSHTSRVNSSSAAAKLCLSGGDANHTLFEEFAVLLARMENNDLCSGEALSPVRALDALARVYKQFEGRSQQDAAEMMTAVLASLEEEGGQYAEVVQLLDSFADDAALVGQAGPNGGAAAMAASSSLLPRQPSGDPASSTAHRSEEGCTDEFSASPLKSVGTASALPGARGAHVIAMLRFMKQVNAENEQLEREVKQRHGKPYLGTFHPPRLRLNPVMDSFRGYSVSQVECHHCRRVSRVVSDFNALLIDVPTNRQRSQFAARHPHLRRLAPDGQQLQAKKHTGFTWWNPLSFFSSAWGRLARLFASSVPFPLTLQECLDIHFEPVKLHGSNQYRCESCGTTSEATKSESLLGLPEYLVLHMKRFEAGRCFNSKKTDPVIFPASWDSLTAAEAAQKELAGRAVPEVLDLRRYLHSVTAPFAEPIPPCLSGSLGAALEDEEAEGAPSPSPQRHASSAFPAATTATNTTASHYLNPNTAATTVPAALSSPSPNPDGTTPGAIPTTYTLDGVVNHHGGYDGGHYTVYLYKTTSEQRSWVYISDDEIERASDGEAADSEEYVLLYRRQPIVRPAVEFDEGGRLRQKARYYLSREASLEASPVSATAGTHSAEAGSTLSSPGTGTAAATPSVSLSFSSSLPSSAASPHVYISRMWLQRVAFLCEPGPIVNRLCYCTAADQQKVVTHRSLFPPDVQVPGAVPHVHGPPVEWFYVPITRADYAIFYDAFGGNAAVTAEEVAAIHHAQEKFVASVTEAERVKPRGGFLAGQR